MKQRQTAAEKTRAAAAASQEHPSLDDIIRRTAESPPSHAIDSKGTLKDRIAVDFWEGMRRKDGGKGDGLASFAVDVYSGPGKLSFRLRLLPISLVYVLIPLLTRTASSVDVERSFSSGRRVVSEFQHNLTHSKVCDIMTVSALITLEVIKPGLLIMERGRQALNRKEKKMEENRRASKAAAEEQTSRAKSGGKKRKRKDKSTGNKGKQSKSRNPLFVAKKSKYAKEFEDSEESEMGSDTEEESEDGSDDESECDSDSEDESEGEEAEDGSDENEDKN